MAEELRSYTPSARERLTSVIFGALGGNDRAGWRTAERITDALDLTPVGAATTAYDAGRSVATGAQQNSPAGLAEGAAMMAMSLMPASAAGRKTVQTAAKPIRAYHGSPHDFDKFDMSKIGTGEGAQAYGHGLYFAENPATAKVYRDKLSDPTIFRAGRYSGPTITDDILPGRAGMLARSSLGQYYERTVDDAVKALEANKKFVVSDDALPDYDAAIEFLRRADRTSGGNPGRMYEVDINADPAAFLNWDVPVSEQGKKVQDAALSGVVGPYRVVETPGGRWQVRHKGGWETQESGGLFKTQAAAERKRQELALQYTARDLVPQRPEEATPLVEVGIPGIRYLDQGSRGAGQGTSNYVLFRDDIIDIVRKYGIAGAAAMLGLSQSDVAQAAQPQETQTPSFGTLMP